jgi:hypothetical protein
LVSTREMERLSVRDQPLLRLVDRVSEVQLAAVKEIPRVRATDYRVTSVLLTHPRSCVAAICGDYRPEPGDAGFD